MAASPEQLDAFVGFVKTLDVPPLSVRQRVGALEFYAGKRTARQAPAASPIPEVALTRNAFVRRAFKEHYDAMRSAASFDTKAKGKTLTPGEQLMYRERAAFHRTRAERAIAEVTRHSVYPELP